MKNFFRPYKSPLCIGIDPPFVKNTSSDDILNYTKTLIDLSKNTAEVIKFQSAYFEAYGVDGIQCLQKGIAHAKSNKLKVILDNKRSDISSTMYAYAQATFDFYDADASTINLYHGVDTVDACLPWLDSGKVIYIVWITSNPSAAQLQSVKLQNSQYFCEYILEQILEFTSNHNTENIGLVLGCTNMNLLSIAHNSMLKFQKYPLLMPGVGYQNADLNNPILKDLAKTNLANLFPVSRGLLIDTTHDKKNLTSLRFTDQDLDTINSNIQRLHQTLATTVS